MEATKATINTIINSQAIVEIPFFQRAYVWGEELWARFLEDVVYVAKNENATHFVGSVIVKNLPYETCDSGVTQKRKMLVDGQQRVTTLMILLKVLSLKFKKTDLFDYIFFGRGKKLLLIHSKNDRAAFEQVIRQSEAEPIHNNESNSLVIDAYNYFLEHIDETGMVIEDGTHYTDIINHIMFVSIELSNGENEQQIFNTLNSLGVNLTTSELLKNYLFSQDTIDQYQTKWIDVFEKDEDTKKYWFGDVDRGAVRRAMIDIFFESYFKLFVQNVMNDLNHVYTISNEDKVKYERSDNLSMSIQNFIAKYCNDDKNVILEHLNEYAETFKESFNPSLCDKSIFGDSALDRLNIVMFGLGHTTLIPYVLYVAKNVNDCDELNKIYSVLESLIMRRMIVKESTNGYNSLFTSLILNKTLTASELIERLRGGEVNTSWIPCDEALENGIKTVSRNRNNLQVKGILFLMECSLQNRKLSATQLRAFNPYTVEHLMPKCWKTHWDSGLSTDEANTRDWMLQTLGNLALITQELNASIQNNDWTTKKNGKDKKRGSGRYPGLNEFASGLFTLHDALTKEEWNEEEIAKRADWLYEQAKEIWKI